MGALKVGHAQRRTRRVGGVGLCAVLLGHEACSLRLKGAVVGDLAELSALESDKSVEVGGDWNERAAGSADTDQGSGYSNDKKKVNVDSLDLLKLVFQCIKII